MNPDPLAIKFKSITDRCAKLAEMFETFRARAEELHRESMFAGTFYYDVRDTSFEGPGFEINFTWKRVRFVWEPVPVKSGDVNGQLVVLGSRIASDLKVHWDRILELSFNINGQIDSSKLPAEAAGLTIGDAADNYYLLMHCLIYALTHHPSHHRRDDEPDNKEDN